MKQTRRMFRSIRFFCLVCGLLLSALMTAVALSMILPEPAQAQMTDELVTVTVEGATKADSAPEAARVIQAQALADTARAKAIEVIGEKRYQKSKSVVESKIVRQAVKFIPFVNSDEPVKQPDGTWKMNVELKLSTSSLRKMILEAGLLTDAQGPASIVPLVAFTDRAKNQSSRWWLGETKDDAHKLLHQVSDLVYEKLQSEFNDQGFHVLRPLGTQSSPVPEALRVERPTQAELKSIAEFYQAPLVLKGDVRFRESHEMQGAAQVSIRLQVVQTSTARTIAEVSRAFDTAAGNYEAVVRNKITSELPEISKDLALQVLEAWQRGTINANLVRLSVKGRLTPKELNDFKSALVRSVKEVKSLHERLFEPDQVVFEVDFAGQAPQLAEKLKSFQMPGFQAAVAGAADQGLVLQLKRAP